MMLMMVGSGDEAAPCTRLCTHARLARPPPHCRLDALLASVASGLAAASAGLDAQDGSGRRAASMQATRQIMQVRGPCRAGARWLPRVAVAMWPARCGGACRLQQLALARSHAHAAMGARDVALSAPSTQSATTQTCLNPALRTHARTRTHGTHNTRPLPPPHAPSRTPCPQALSSLKGAMIQAGPPPGSSPSGLHITCILDPLTRTAQRTSQVCLCVCVCCVCMFISCMCILDPLTRTAQRTLAGACLCGVLCVTP